MNRISILILLVTLAACSKKMLPVDQAAEPVVAQSNAIIEVIKERERVILDRPSTILRLSIIDGDLPQRNVVIRITQSAPAPKGALILTTSGFGGVFYGGNAQRNETIDFALSKGLQVFEVKWEGEYGWGTNVEGVGYTLAVRAFSRIVEWLKENSIVNSSLIICQGGSGGAMQIAYGLTNFNLEETIDYAILTAGPPTSDLARAIYGATNDQARWPEGLLGLGKTDYILGWHGNGDYCEKRAASAPDFVMERLKSESLVNSSSAKDYNYETTKLYFINTDDVTHADDQSRLYYDSIISEKDWTFLSGETSHNVGGIDAGAIRIREILKEIVN